MSISDTDRMKPHSITPERGRRCPAADEPDVSPIPTQHYLAHDKLRDGRDVVIRAIRPEDKRVLQEVMHHLSDQSRYFRFLTPKVDLTPKELMQVTEIDYLHHVALLASTLEGGRESVIAIGEYVTSEELEGPPSAELAFAVEEEYQGLGVATALLRHLAIIARVAGIVQFTAVVHPANCKMIEVFAHSGLPMTSRSVVAALEITLTL